MNNYTKETVAELNKILEINVLNKTILEQDEIDKLVKILKIAIKNLKLIEVNSTIINERNLPNTGNILTNKLSFTFIMTSLYIFKKYHKKDN